MRIRPLYYGWYEEKTRLYRLSSLPPDAPVRPSREFESLKDVYSLLEKKRAEIMWWPPLPQHAMTL